MGIDVAAVRDQKLLKRGVITAEQAENMSQKEIHQYLIPSKFLYGKERLLTSPDVVLVLML